MRIVGCFLEHDGKFAILLRRSHKPDGNTWGLPSGKVEAGESDAAAMVRELQEETGYKATITELEHMGDFDFGNERGKPYTFVTYRVLLNNPHEIKLEVSAHAGFLWVTPEECYSKPDLITDFHQLLDMVHI